VDSGVVVAGRAGFDQQRPAADNLVHVTAIEMVMTVQRVAAANQIVGQDEQHVGTPRDVRERRPTGSLKDYHCHK
jgi:hypothetical protein